MTPILRFLQSLRSLQKSGVIKSVDEAYDFAKREFGEINDLLKDKSNKYSKQVNLHLNPVKVALLQLKMLQRNRNQESWIK
jgi:hypothetical protein